MRTPFVFVVSICRWSVYFLFQLCRIHVGAHKSQQIKKNQPTIFFPLCLFVILISSEKWLMAVSIFVWFILSASSYCNRLNLKWFIFRGDCENFDLDVSDNSRMRSKSVASVCIIDQIKLSLTCANWTWKIGCLRPNKQNETKTTLIRSQWSTSKTATPFNSIGVFCTEKKEKEKESKRKEILFSFWFDCRCCFYASFETSVIECVAWSISTTL